jgi:hypothetical protein
MLQLPTRRPSEHDPVVVAPAGAERSKNQLRVGDVDGGAAGQRQFAYLTGDEETHPLPVGRKEGADGALGARNHGRIRLIELPNIEGSSIRAQRRKNERSAVRRQRERGSRRTPLYAAN